MPKLENAGFTCKGFYLVVHTPGYNGHVLHDANFNPILFSTRKDAEAARTAISMLGYPAQIVIEQAFAP